MPCGRILTAAMRIRLDDERLLAHMREAASFAYRADETSLEVLRPTRGAVETAEITALLERWTVDHPGGRLEIVADR